MASESPASRALETVEVRPICTPAAPEAEQAAQAWVSTAKRNRRAVSPGEVFTAAGHEFALVACTPSTGSNCGTLTPTTEVSMVSTPVPVMLRVQLTCLEEGPDQSEDDLYQDFIRPVLLRRRLDRRQDHDGRYLFVVAQDQVMKACDKEFGVRALDPTNRYGAIDPSTAVFVSSEDTPSLAKVHVLPFQDTLPVAYTYSLFRDFLQPFFQAHPFAVYGLGDVFTFNGVRFRIMATEPDGKAARVGTQTIVYYQGEPLRPTVWDLMPPELRQDLQRLPRGLQMLLVNTMANEEAVRFRLSEVQEVLRRGQGLGTTEIDSCGKLIIWKSDERHSDTQQTCMVCLSDFVENDRLRELHCSHLFHVDCIDEWLRRSPACPICKQPCSKSSAASGGDPGASANILRGAIVICSRGEGRVLGFDAESKRFKVRIESSGSEELLVQEDFVQAVHGVHLVGLRMEEDLNGKVCQIVGFDSDRGRYQVFLDSERVLAVKPEHCILPEGVVARVEGLREDGSGARWNGHYGRVVSFDRPRMRHVLSMQPRGQLLSVKAKNLRV